MSASHVLVFLSLVLGALAVNLPKFDTGCNTFYLLTAVHSRAPSVLMGGGLYANNDFSVMNFACLDEDLKDIYPLLNFYVPTTKTLYHLHFDMNHILDKKFSYTFVKITDKDNFGAQNPATRNFLRTSSLDTDFNFWNVYAQMADKVFANSSYVEDKTTPYYGWNKTKVLTTHSFVGDVEGYHLVILVNPKNANKFWGLNISDGKTWLYYIVEEDRFAGLPDRQYGWMVPNDEMYKGADLPGITEEQKAIIKEVQSMQLEGNTNLFGSLKCPETKKIDNLQSASARLAISLFALLLCLFALF